MSFDITDQGGAGGKPEDIGFDLEPANDPSSEKEGQSEENPEPPKSEGKKPEGEEDGNKSGATKNAAAKDQRVREKRGKISEEEWQGMVESNRTLTSEVENLRMERERDRFERKNPIVTDERFSEKWEEFCEKKADPENAFHKLSFEELKAQMLGSEPELLEENMKAEEEVKKDKQKPPSPPKFGSTPNAKKMPGNVDPEVYQDLKDLGYSDEMIQNSGDVTKL